jgi:hypothetical protein
MSWSTFVPYPFRVQSPKRRLRSRRWERCLDHDWNSASRAMILDVSEGTPFLGGIETWNAAVEPGPFLAKQVTEVGKPC